MIDPTNSNIKNSKDLAENLSLKAFSYYLLSDCVRRQRDIFFTTGIRVFFPTDLFDSPLIHAFTILFSTDDFECLLTEIKLNMHKMMYDAFYLVFNKPFKIKIYVCDLLDDDYEGGDEDEEEDDEERILKTRKIKIDTNIFFFG